MEGFFTFDSLADLLTTFLMVAVLAGFAEELFFRGLVLRLLSEVMNPHLAIFLAAMLFSIIHLQVLNFLPILFMGILFGYLYYWSGSIWLPVIGHFIHNGAQVVMIYLFEKGTIETDIESIETVPTHLVIGSILLLAGLLYLFYKNGKIVSG